MSIVNRRTSESSSVTRRRNTTRVGFESINPRHHRRRRQPSPLEIGQQPARLERVAIAAPLVELEPVARRAGHLQRQVMLARPAAHAASRASRCARRTAVARSRSASAAAGATPPDAARRPRSDRHHRPVREHSAAPRPFQRPDRVGAKPADLGRIGADDRRPQPVTRPRAAVVAPLADADAVDKLFRDHEIQRVVNLAAQAGVRYSLENPRAYIDSNVVGFINLLENCRHTQVEHLVYASSSSVYGANRVMPFSVRHNVDHPLSLYAATKKTNELMAHTYSHLYTLPTTGLRFFTVYGPWGRPDMALFVFAHKMLAGEPIDIFNYGKHTRDFTFVDDIVEGVVARARPGAATRQRVER